MAVQTSTDTTNKYFSVKTDTDKQYFHATLKGDWIDEEIGSEFRKCISDVLTILKPGFTVLVDLSNFKLPSITSLEYIKQAQKRCVVAGMKKSAEISPESAYTKIAINRITTRNNIDLSSRKSFSNLKEAKEWLNLD